VARTPASSRPDPAVIRSTDFFGAQSLQSRPYIQQFAVVAVAYYVAGRLGLSLSLVGRSVTPLWPPTGVAVVALLALGRRLWPAIVIAAFAINAPISPTVLAAAAIAAGNVLAPVAAVSLLLLADFRPNLARVRDATVLVLLGALLSMAISATVGSLTLLWSDAISAREFAGTWSVWWTGDAMGVLIIAPFVWSLRPNDSGETRPPIEIIGACALLVVACAAAMSSNANLMFVVLPVVCIIAWRFGQRGAARANLVVSVVATFVAARKWGPFAGMSLTSRMVTLQSFNATVAFTSILLAAAVSQRQQLARRQHDAVETLQRSLLPDHLPDAPGFEFASRYLPASADIELGGDWYDVFAMPQGRYGFVVGDVAGHGILAAAVMGKLRMALRAYSLDDLSPRAVVARLNTLLRQVQPHTSATLWYGEYDLQTRALTFTNAGHVPPIVICNDGTSSYLEPVHGPPVGAVESVAYDQAEWSLAADSTLLLYTDGLVERRGISIDVGLRALQESVRSPARDLDATCDGVLDALLDGSHEDDVALLAIRAHSLAGRELRLRRTAIPAAVPETRQIMKAWLADNGVDGAEAFDILVAASEACSNAVTHAYQLAPGQLQINASIADSELVITVQDSGTWRSSSPDNTGGRGMAIMRGLMDRVEVNTAHGTEVRMCRRLRGTKHDQ
jgi:integral membrane sensor domain MASE1/anti-sigma regulatory factor (Ser/Thr protein kinase)